MSIYLPEYIQAPSRTPAPSARVSAGSLRPPSPNAPGLAPLRLHQQGSRKRTQKRKSPLACESFGLFDYKHVLDSLEDCFASTPNWLVLQTSTLKLLEVLRTYLLK